jgi:hypothetical protein
MAIPQLESNVSVEPAFENKKVLFICPDCKAKKALGVPISVIKKAKQITTMSIARGLVCDHQFQAFVDKNFSVRGYQRVDFELESQSSEKKDKDSRDFKETEEELLDNLILEGNYVEYKPKKRINYNKRQKGIEVMTSPKNDIQKNKQEQKQKNEMTLKEIYEEFRDFIDKDNEKFAPFIENDA